SPFEALQSFAAGNPAPNGIAGLRQRYADIQEALAAYQALTGKELVAALFPPDAGWAEAMTEAAATLIEDPDDVADVYEKLRVGITQPELPESGDYVRIMSLHKSKGLTSRVVIIAGCVLGLIPFVDRDLAEAEQETLEQEQRRLFYVALTRPTERLVISSS